MFRKYLDVYSRILTRISRGNNYYERPRVAVGTLVSQIAAGRMDSSRSGYWTHSDESPWCASPSPSDIIVSGHEPPLRAKIPPILRLVAKLSGPPHD